MNEADEEKDMREKHKKEEERLADVWKQKPQLEKTKEEEYEEYFSALFM